MKEELKKEELKEKAIDKSQKEAKKEEKNDPVLLSQRKRTTTDYVKNTLNIGDKELYKLILELNQELMENEYRDYIKLLLFLEYELIYDDFYTEEEKEYLTEKVYQKYMHDNCAFIISEELHQIVEAVKEEIINNRKVVDGNEQA